MLLIGWSKHVSTSLWHVDTTFSILHGVTTQNIVTFTVNIFGPANFMFWFSPVFLILKFEFLGTMWIILETENTVTVTVVSQNKKRLYLHFIEQGYTNNSRQFDRESKFCTVAPNICGGLHYGSWFMSPFWNLEVWRGAHIFGKFVHSW